VCGGRLSVVEESSLFSIRRLLLAAGAAGMVASVAVGPVAGYTLQNVLVSSFKSPGPAGTVALTKTGAGTLNLSYSLVGLSPNSEYEIRFNNRKCASPGAAIADVAFKSSGKGTSFASTILDDAAALTSKSARLMRNGTQVDCALFADFNGDGDVDGADFLTIIDKPGAKGIVDLQRTADPAIDRLVITLVGLQPGAYTLRASTKPCSSTHHHPTDTILGYQWGVSQSGGFKAQTTVTHESGFEAWVSIRVLLDGQQIVCAKTYKSFAP